MHVSRFPISWDGVQTHQGSLYKKWSIQLNSQLELQFLFSLRYNPLRRVRLKPLPVQYFIPGSYEPFILEILLKQEIKKLIDGHKRVAISHSAGVDSNLVLALIRELDKNLQILCLCMDGPEVDSARALAEQHNARFIVVRPPSVIENISRYVRMTGEARWNVYHEEIARVAKMNGCDLLLTGDGADELFAGYVFRYGEFLNRYKSLGFAGAYMNVHRNDWINERFFSSPIPGLIQNHLYQFASAFLEPIEQILYADFNGKLVYDSIPTTMAISRTHKINIKSPFLSQSVIEHALQIPVTEKLKNGIGKIPLRDMLAQRGVAVSTKKMGFTYDLVADWNSNCVALRPSLVPQVFEYINRDWYIENFHVRQNDYAITNKLVQIFCLNELLRYRGY